MCEANNPNYEPKYKGKTCIYCDDKIDENKTYYIDYSDDYFCSRECFEGYHGFKEVEDD